MRTFDEIMADAEAKSPFPNGTSFEFWFDAWCAQCINDPDDENEQAVNGCPLILAMLTGYTPKELVPTANPSRVPQLGSCSVDCLMYRDEDGGPDPEPQPIPDPPGMEPMFPREPYEGARMLRPISETEMAHA